tara:strand:+ start:2734 stop:8724 length:5991 start_codon:yes stop_codon:yes gene_type:complete
MSKISTQELIFLELGQIIQINASENLKIHEKIFIIDYLDDKTIELIQQDDLSNITLNIVDGNITDETIESIFILENPIEKGYAKQNDLIPGNWISIYFDADTPLLINGLISDIQEDMIEITTYPNKETIYIDFEYKGIPKNLNIVSIQHIEKPGSKSTLEDQDPIVDIEKTAKLEISPEIDEDDMDDDLELDLELDLDTEEQAENIKEAFIDLDDIEILDEDLGEITQEINVSEQEKRYSVDMQTTDLLDELLASIPTNERTSEKLNKIHILIERFKQLRRKFSMFNEEGNAEKIFKKGSNYKPLVENFKQFNKKLAWILPVIKNKKNLYDKEHSFDEDDENINVLGIDFALNDEFQLIYQYYKNAIPDGQNKYKFLYQNLKQYFTPHIEPTDLTNIIKIQEVMNDFEVLLDNIPDFYSTTMSSDNDLFLKPQVNINQNRFVMQRFNTGLTHLVNPDPQNKKSVLYLDNLTTNDILFLKGFFTLPQSIIKYSKISLPKTNILEKSQLNKINFSYFKILNEFTNFKKRTIIENKDQVKSKKKLDIFDKPLYTNFEELRIFDDRSDDTQVYEDYLNKLIPKTKELFHLFKKYIKAGVSFHKVIEQLEPFLIYDDDITFKQYHDIMNFVTLEIDRIKRRLVINKDKYTKYLTSQQNYDVHTILPSLIKSYYFGDTDIFSSDGYNIHKEMPTDISLKKIIDIDCGRTYLNALASDLISFAQPIDIEKSIMEEIDAVKTAGEMGNSKECEPIVLAKKYNDIEELEQDSRDDIDVFFDRKYDDTPYDIGHAWKDNYGDIEDEPDIQITKLTEFLMKNNGLVEDKALRDATSMILGSKMVQNGDYAILDLGDMDYKYYIRSDNKWKLDKTKEGQSIETMNFCNLKDNCIKINKQCIGLDESKELLQKNFFTQVTEKLEEQIRMSLSDLKVTIETNLIQSLNNIKKLKNLKTRISIERDFVQLKIASQLDVEDMIISPYAELRDVILSQSDLVKKFNNIQIFIEKFCRDYDLNNTDESPYWFYCIDTNVKLLPTFYFTLAEAFSQGIYQEILESVCKDRGQISDDNDKIIDKYSGYIIKFIEFDDSEGYDESGYKIVSREIMLENIDVLSFKSNMVKDKQFDYETTLAKDIKKFLEAFDKKLQINSEDEHPFMIRLTIDSLNKNLMDERKYKELMERKKKNKKPVKPYAYKHDEILLKSLSAAYIIGVQCSIPNISSDVTFSICIKSFNGFPLNGNSDMGFVNYFNCVLMHLRRGKDRPWIVLPKANRSNFQDKVDKLNTDLHKFMTEKILKIDYVVEKIQQKRVWNMENKDIEFISENFDVQLWHNYLPPLMPITVSDLQNIGDNFEKLLVSDIQSSNVNQFIRLWGLYGNIVKNSFSIFESVQKAIDSEPMLLASMSNVPFLENACCNEGEPSTYYYFINKEKSIEKYNERVKKTSDIYEKYTKILIPSMLNFTKDTKIVFPSIDSHFSEDVIYLAFIKFCQFNSGVVLDDDLQRLCVKNTAGFRSSDTLERKIDIMKSEGLNYSGDTLKALIHNISRKNIINFNIDPAIITEKMYLESVIEYLSEKSTVNIPHSEIIPLIHEVIDRFSISHKKEKESDPTIEKFNFKIKEWNEELSQTITEKLHEHGELKRNLKDLILNFKLQAEKMTKKAEKRSERYILNWKLVGEEIYMYKEEETNFTIFNLLKQMTQDILTIYPNIILNKVKKYSVPSHWKLSQRHVSDVNKIMERDYEYFKKYYGNKNINAVLNYVLKNNEDILRLLDAIPFFSKIMSEESKESIFNGEMCKNIGLYLFLSSIMLYINSFDAELEIDVDEDDMKTSVMGAPTDELIIRGEKEELEKISCKLISNYLKIVESYKKMLNITPEDVTKNVLKSKEKEKAKITANFRDLADEERKVENIMKNHSLGDWSIGQTRAIFEYDENQYDKEREELEKTALMEMKMGIRDEVTEFSSEIYQLNMIDSDVYEFMEQEAVQAQIDSEVFNLAAIAEDGEEVDDAVDYM